MLIVSIIATHYFLLLGLGAIHGGQHRHKISYPKLMASMHSRAIVFGLIFAFIPTALGMNSMGKVTTRSATFHSDHGSTSIAPRRLSGTQIAGTVSHIAAIASLLFYVCHSSIVCNGHRIWTSQAHGYNRMFSDYRDNPEADDFVRGTNRNLTSFVAETLQIHGQNWISAKDSPHDSETPNAALMTLIFIASGSMNILLCVFLADSMFPKPQAQGASLVDVRVLTTALCFGLTGFVALHMRARRRDISVDPAEAISEVIASITRILCAVLPLCILVEWAVSATTPLLFDVFQIALFIAGYVFQSSRDD
jgi:Ca2+/H+ antiporter